MRLFDMIRSGRQDRKDYEELKALHRRLSEGRGKRAGIIARLPLPRLAGDLLDFEGVFSEFDLPETMSIADVVQASELLRHLIKLQNEDALVAMLGEFVSPFAGIIPEPADGDDFGLRVSLFGRLSDPVSVVDHIVRRALASEFWRLKGAVQTNLFTVSKIDPRRPTTKPFVMPKDVKNETPAAIAEKYLAGTPFLSFFNTPYPITIPFRTRFEHTHIVGGTGHGKTQLLQTLLLRDLEKLREGRGSIIVIDSQGDLLRNILNLAWLAELHDRLVLIDPNDVEHPPCLNLFDFGLDRLGRYNPVEREKLINGAISLYEYLFGALLGAELTQRQGVIFRYLARLMMVVPNGTIHTLMQFMESPEATRPHLPKLDRMARHFFETQFFSSAFDDTRQQILTRLWGVLSNGILERMFGNEKNKLDLFDAMNRGSIILINTAKDLLKQEGCEILGRFFIAMICQAAQERTAIPEDRRRATFLYIDEAADYFDESMENLLSQARKYKVGLILAHQNLGQFDTKLQATVMANTAIKLAGGLSANDALAFSREMGCEREYLQGMRKRHDHTEFACFIRNVTPRPVRLSVPFGQMEGQPRISEVELSRLLSANRSRFCAIAEDRLVQSQAPPTPTRAAFPPEDDELL